MTYEEYKKGIDGLITNPDEAPVNIIDILKNLESDLTVLESLKADNEALNGKVKTLQETNIKLYMSQGGTPTEESTQEEETVDSDIEAVESFFNEIGGE